MTLCRRYTYLHHVFEQTGKKVKEKVRESIYAYSDGTLEVSEQYCAGKREKAVVHKTGASKAINASAVSDKDTNEFEYTCR